MSVGATLVEDRALEAIDAYRRLATVCRLLSRLPAVPVHDWCDRTASALAHLMPGGVGVVAICENAGAGRVTHTWVGGVGGTGGMPESQLMDLRCRIDAISGECCGAGERSVRVASAAETGSLEPGWRSLGVDSVVMGKAPMSPDGPTLMVMVGSSEQAATGWCVDALGALLPVAAEVACGAIGCSRRRESDWVTAREQEVLDLLVMGYSVREIAQQLSRSPHTVHDHVKSLHRKMGATSRGELVALALGRRPEPGKAG